MMKLPFASAAMRCILLLALVAGCSAPVDETPKVKEVVSLDDRLEEARWVSFLMDELNARKPASSGGNQGDFEIALLLEIASYDLFILRIAAEAVEARNDYESIWDYHPFIALICSVRLDREPRSDEDGRTFSGWPVVIEDGKLKIPHYLARSWSGPIFVPLTDYSDGRTMHEIDVGYHGLRDLSPYSSQRLTEDQLDELRGKYADWDGDLFVPDEPAAPHFIERYDGLTWEALGSVRSIENESALSALRAANIGTSVLARAGTTYISVHPDVLERARKAVRADAEEHGYVFRE